MRQTLRWDAVILGNVWTITVDEEEDDLGFWWWGSMRPRHSAIDEWRAAGEPSRREAAAWHEVMYGPVDALHDELVWRVIEMLDHQLEIRAHDISGDRTNDDTQGPWEHPEVICNVREGFRPRIIIRGHQLRVRDLEVVEFANEVWLRGTLMDDLPDQLRGEYAPGAPTDHMSAIDLHGELIVAFDAANKKYEFHCFEVVAGNQDGVWRIRCECQALTRLSLVTLPTKMDR
jgi:hypothetical protein